MTCNDQLELVGGFMISNDVKCLEVVKMFSDVLFSCFKYVSLIMLDQSINYAGLPALGLC